MGDLLFPHVLWWHFFTRQGKHKLSSKKSSCSWQCCSFFFLLLTIMFNHFSINHSDQIYIAPSGVQKERIQVSSFQPVHNKDDSHFLVVLCLFLMLYLWLYSARGYVCVWCRRERHQLSSCLEEVKEKPVYATFYERLHHERLVTPQTWRPTNANLFLPICTF